MKRINTQSCYLVDDKRYTHVAFNRFGGMVGFLNPPVRDPRNDEWVDCTDGSAGELIPCDSWDTSVRATSTLVDPREEKRKHDAKVEAERLQRYRESLKNKQPYVPVSKYPNKEARLAAKRERYRLKRMVENASKKSDEGAASPVA